MLPLLPTHSLASAYKLIQILKGGARVVGVGSLDTLRQMANALRVLAIDGVEKATSGHPGMPLGMADVATVLWSQFLRFDPEDSRWLARDRFVLSAGHGSMLLYGLLYLTGYPFVTREQLMRFRALGSLTPGHPERETPGVEVTTGPLAQGLSHAVGMALAERLLAKEFGEELVSHWTYVMAGDGCLMEGLSQEAISFAGHLQLGRLIVLFDDNGITIDGPTSLSTSEDHLKRFEACGWHIQAIDGHDMEAIQKALNAAQEETKKPSLIACRTTIGWGAPTKAGTAGVHGSPLGQEEAGQARKALGGEHLKPFDVSDEALSLWRTLGEKNHQQAQTWRERLSALGPALQTQLQNRLHRVLPTGWQETFWHQMHPLFTATPSWATRQWSQKVLETLGPLIPGLLGGSADLTPSNNTQTKGMKAIAPGDFKGSYIHYGIREHAMGGIMNGVVLHGGFIPYGGTFLTFSDYMRTPIRLSALMELPTIFVMTHDSIGLGEDGPTHQPIEHLASLRAMPNLNVFRPACGVEVAECWVLALESTQTPSLLALSRQPVRSLRPSERMEANLSSKGAYVLLEADTEHKVTMLATGSEVGLAVDVRTLLEQHGIGCRVVSMPAWRLFEQQADVYRTLILSQGQDILRVAIEAASPFGWERYVGERGLIFGLSTFGASAPCADLYTHFGLTSDVIAEKIRGRLFDGT